MEIANSPIMRLDCQHFNVTAIPYIIYVSMDLLFTRFPCMLVTRPSCHGVGITHPSTKDKGDEGLG